MLHFIGTNRVYVEPCQDNNTNQKWTFNYGMIVNTVEAHRRLDIYNRESINNGAAIIEVEIDKASTTKLWEIV